MKSFLIIGAGKFGQYLCRKLTELGNEIMVADENEAKLAGLLDYVQSAKIGDCTRPEVLKTFGVEDFDACVVCINDDFQSSLQITDLLKELGAKKVVALASTEIHEKFLLRNGADMVIFPERDLAERISVSMSNDSILDYIKLSGEYSICEICTPTAWLGKTIAQMQVRSAFGLNLIAIKRDGEIHGITAADYIFNREDHLMVMGHNDNIHKVARG